MLYQVQLWGGAGYWLNPPVTVEAHDEEEALVLASIEDKNSCFVECNDCDDEQFNELDDADNYVYLDRTEHDHSNIFLLIENARITEVRQHA